MCLLAADACNSRDHQHTAANYHCVPVLCAQSAAPPTSQQPSSVPLLRPQPRSTQGAASQQHAAKSADFQLPNALWQQQLHEQPPQQQQQPAALQLQQQHVPASWSSPQQQQQQVRPLHAGQHVQQMTQLVVSCDSLLQLQAVLSVHLHQFTPSCITTAMQQLHKLRQQELQQPAVSGGDMGQVMQAVQLQLAGQLTQALLKQLPVVSGTCLAGFLAAAASMRLVMPTPVLEQLATHLVFKALRTACHQHNAAAAAAAGHTTRTRSAADVQQQQQQGQSQGQASSSTEQQQQQSAPRQPSPHVAVLSAWALAKLKLRSDPLWSEVVSIAGEQLASMSPADCVLLAYACARAGQHQSRLFFALQQQLRPHAARLPPGSISSLLWSYATAGQYHQGWVSALLGSAADKMERFSPADLATGLWACGRMRHADARMLSALRVQALACMSHMQAPSLSNLAWSLATLQVADEALTAAVISRAGQLAGEFHMQGLSNVAWAVVKLLQQLKHTPRAKAPAAWADLHGSGLRSDSAHGSSSRQQSVGQSSQRELSQAAHALLEQLCSAAVTKVTAAKPQEVCNLLWACATLRHRHDAFLTAAAARLAAVAVDALPVDLAQALWSLESVRFRCRTTQQALLLSSLNRLHLFGPQALSNLAWAVATSGMRYPAGLPDAVAQQLQALLPDMSPQGLANTLWALSKMGRVPQQLVHAASSHIRAQLPLYIAQDLCNVAMVAAKAGYKEPSLLQDLAAAASSAAAVTLSAAGCSSGEGIDDTQAAGLQGSAAPRACSADLSARKRLTQQGVRNLVWAFAGTGWCDSELMQQLQRVAVLHLPHMQPGNVAALCQGFALLGQPFDDILAALPTAGAGAAGGQHKKRHKQPHPPAQYQQHRQHLEGLQAHLGAAAPATAGLQVHSFMQQLVSWPADGLALLLHSMVVTGAQDRHAPLVLALLRLLAQRGAAETLSPQRLRQLHMALTQLALQWGVASAAHLLAHSSTSQPALVQQLLGDALVAPGSSQASSLIEQQPRATGSAAAEQLLAAAACRAGAGVPGSQTLVPDPPPGQLAAELLTGALAQVCMRSWQQHEAVKQLSRVEQEIVGVLQGMGLQPLAQHWLQLTYSRQSSTSSNRALAVNVGVPAASLGPGRRPLALAVLAPAALSSSSPQQVLGHTRLDHACLTSAGWQVVWLSWEDWDSLGGSHTQQAALLRRLCGL